MTTETKPKVIANVRVHERISLIDRSTPVFQGAQMQSTVTRGVTREEGERILKERIEAGKEKYGELVHSRIWANERSPDGWLYMESSYFSKDVAGSPVYNAVIDADGSVYGF